MIFLSRTSIQPYDPISGIEIGDTITISDSQSMDVIETATERVYLVVIDEQYDKLELRVENENSRGASLYISESDPLGQPLHWGKQIIFQNVDAKLSDFVVPLLYQWRVVNNIYFVVNTTPTAKLNIYGTVNYTT